MLFLHLLQLHAACQSLMPQRRPLFLNAHYDKRRSAGKSPLLINMFPAYLEIFWSQRQFAFWEPASLYRLANNSSVQHLPGLRVPFFHNGVVWFYSSKAPNNPKTLLFLCWLHFSELSGWSYHWTHLRLGYFVWYLCTKKSSINQRAFYAKVCKIDRAGYKIFFPCKKRCMICPSGHNAFSAYSSPKYDGACSREDRRQDDRSLKYKQIAIRRKGSHFFCCVSRG